MINRFRTIFQPVCLLVLVLLSGVTGAQEFQVHRSEDKVILEGKIYYIHIVKEKETLYGISKAYNVTQKVIASENPDVFAGLRTGMVLKIPAEPIVDESVPVRDTEDFIYHVVREGETLYFLSRKYGIDVLEIEKANPEVTVSDLQVNQWINDAIADYNLHFSRLGQASFTTTAGQNCYPLETERGKRFSIRQLRVPLRPDGRDAIQPVSQV